MKPVTLRPCSICILWCLLALSLSSELAFTSTWARKSWGDRMPQDTGRRGLVQSSQELPGFLGYTAAYQGFPHSLPVSHMAHRLVYSLLAECSRNRRLLRRQAPNTGSGSVKTLRQARQRNLRLWSTRNTGLSLSLRSRFHCWLTLCTLGVLCP